VTGVPAIDVHAHVLLPGVDEAVAGQPGLLAARELDAGDAGPGSTRRTPDEERARAGG